MNNPVCPMCGSREQPQENWAKDYQELNKNAEYRRQAVQPMVDELKKIRLIAIDTVAALHEIHEAMQKIDIANDLLAELIRRTR